MKWPANYYRQMPGNNIGEYRGNFYDQTPSIPGNNYYGQYPGNYFGQMPTGNNFGMPGTNFNQYPGQNPGTMFGQPPFQGNYFNGQNYQYPSHPHYYPRSPSSTQMFAPYCYVLQNPQFNISTAMQNTGVKYYSLAFILADSNGDPSWGGEKPITSDFYREEIAKVRSIGGDVIISFGGASGTELGHHASNQDPNTLLAKYQSVISTYNAKMLDFDIEKIMTCLPHTVI